MVSRWLPYPRFAASTAQPAESAQAASPGGGWPARRLALAGLLLLACAAAAVLADLPLARAVKEHRLPGEFQRLVRLAETFAWGGTVGLIILTAALLDCRGGRVALPLALCAYGAGLLADSLKWVAARQRPSVADLSAGAGQTFAAWFPLAAGLDDYGYRLQSFPSGHAATAAGLAAALAVLYPRGRWLFVLFAALACWQRIDARAHFASDVLTGAAIGCLVAAAVARSQMAARNARVSESSQASSL